MESLNSEFTGTAQIAKELKLSRNPFQNDIEDYVYIYIFVQFIHVYTAIHYILQIALRLKFQSIPSTQPRRSE